MRCSSYSKIKQEYAGRARVAGQSSPALASQQFIRALHVAWDFRGRRLWFCPRINLRFSFFLIPFMDRDRSSQLARCSQLNVPSHVRTIGITAIRSSEACHSKHKVFFWLLAQDRLNTRQLLQKKAHFLPDYSCEMCACSLVESRNHLFFYCPFVLLCSRYISPN
jgi:hypothetical protein